MPIDIETFDEASEDDLEKPTNGKRVVQFLVENDEQAFTPAEIADRTDVKRSSIGTVLRRLEERGLVRHKGAYWAAGDEDAIRDAYEFHRLLEAADDRFGEEDLDEWREYAAGSPDG